MSVKHVIVSKKNNEEMKNLYEYEKIMNGNLKEKSWIVKTFYKRLKVIESIRRKKIRK